MSPYDAQVSLPFSPKVLTVGEALRLALSQLPTKGAFILRNGKVAESDEPRLGVILDYDKLGRIVSIELLDASEQVAGPQSVEFALAEAD